MGKTSIGWTGLSWNAITARCSRVAPECDLCYSLANTDRWHGAGTFESEPPVLIPARLTDTLLSPEAHTEQRVFVSSTSDPFHPGIPVADQAKVWATMAGDQFHEFQFLSKRPRPGLKLLTRADFPELVLAEMPRLIDRLAATRSPRREQAIDTVEVAVKTFTWPLRNVLVGVSAGSQETADKFLPDLARIPAARRFLSWEPALGATDLTGYLPFLDWVILGGESGTVSSLRPREWKKGRARVMELEWALSVMDQVTAAGVAPFMKQLGTVQAHLLGLHQRGAGKPKDYKGEKWEFWPAELEALKIRRHPRMVPA